MKAMKLIEMLQNMVKCDGDLEVRMGICNETPIYTIVTICNGDLKPEAFVLVNEDSDLSAI